MAHRATRCRVVSARRGVWVVVSAVVLIVALAACDDGSPGDVVIEDDPEELPDWLDRVYPPPGAEITATRALQVEHERLGDDEHLRLVIDGTDVTIYADRRLTLLEYDPSEDDAPVDFGPGRHEATVEYVRLPEAGEPHEVIDVFTWSFIVQ